MRVADGDQPRGVDEVRGAALVDPDLEVGPALTSAPGRAGVVEVDVGQQDGRGRSSPSAASSVSTDDSGPGSMTQPSMTWVQTARSAPWKWTSISRWASGQVSAGAQALGLSLASRREPRPVSVRGPRRPPVRFAHGPPPPSSRPSVDDAHLRGPLDREEVQRALPRATWPRARRGCRSRSTCRPRPAMTPTTSSRAARSARSACRSPTRATCTSSWMASRSAR